MNTLDMVIVRDPDIAWRSIEGEIMVVNSKSSLIYPLDEVASRIWELLDGVKTCREIAGVIDDEFEGDKEGLKNDTASFIEDLIDAGLAKPCA